MSKVLAVGKTVLSLLAYLKQPGVATAVAGVIVPIVFGITGTNFPVQTVGGWFVGVGAVAVALERALPGGLLKPAPTPPAPPAK